LIERLRDWMRAQSGNQFAQSGNQLPDYPITRLPDSRGPQAIGRAARLELVFAVRHGRTVLAHSYAEPPFRILRPFDLGGAAYVIIVCSGPGIFGGDTLQQSVHVGRGARVVLTSQAALQVHPSAPPAAAVIRHEYSVGDEAELHCEWDPVIPFAHARLDQRFDLRIEETSRVYWSDAVVAGRVSRGEVWQCESLAHELRLRVAGALAYLERYDVTPADRAVERPWIAGGARYLATALVHHPDATTEAAAALHQGLAGLPGVHGGADLVARRLVAARLLAGNGAPFSRARASYRRLALESIFRAPELAARK
jgi:urease accessory protein UreH